MANPLTDPDLRDDLPRYPPLIQMLRVTSVTVPGPAGAAQALGSSVLGPLLYAAFTEQMQADTLLPRDREPCLVDDVNNVGLAPGFYLGRLAGSYNSLPLYEVVGTRPGTARTQPTTIDYTDLFLTLDNTVINFFKYHSIVNYLGIDNVFFNLSQYLVWLIEGPGYMQIDAPVEIGGDFFWDCADFTFATATVDNWKLPADAVVFLLTAAGGGTSLSGIEPRPFGAPVNTGPVTDATDASPIVLTVPGWTIEPTVGEALVVADVLGNTAANGTWTVLAVTATTVTLQGSTGNGIFAASPGSTVQLAGPQIVALVNVGTDPITLQDNLSNSLPANRFRVPYFWTLGTEAKVVLQQNDAALLWWDACTGYRWMVLATTTIGTYVQHGGGTRVGPRHTISFNDSASVAFSVADNSVNDRMDVTATATGGGSTTSNSDVVLDSGGGTVTATFADVGPGATLPAIGKYVVTAQVVGSLTPQSGVNGDAIQVQLRDSTTPANLTQGALAHLLYVQNTTGAPVKGTAVLVAKVVTTAINEVVKVQARYVSVGTPAAATLDATVISYIRVA